MFKVRLLQKFSAHMYMGTTVVRKYMPAGNASMGAKQHARVHAAQDSSEYCRYNAPATQVEDSNAPFCRAFADRLRYCRSRDLCNPNCIGYMRMGQEWINICCACTCALVCAPVCR
jgi:hypothetical protein